MNQTKLMELNLLMKELRAAYWEEHGRIPSMADIMNTPMEVVA